MRREALKKFPFSLFKQPLQTCMMTTCLIVFFNKRSSNCIWSYRTKEIDVNTVMWFFLPYRERTIPDYKCEVWILCEGWDPIPGRFVELAEEIIAFIWNGHSAFIWVNGAEGEIFSSSLTLCQHIEKGWLPGNKSSGEVKSPESAGLESSGLMWWA